VRAASTIVAAAPNDGETAPRRKAAIESAGSRILLIMCFLLSSPFFLKTREWTGAVADALIVQPDFVKHRHKEVRQWSIVRVNDVPSSLENVLPSRKNDVQVMMRVNVAIAEACAIQEQ
jgi:hypothetical protein